ncbi:hypothetical protein [Methylobacterium haplocladii]|uniref:Uncharacterized protein n=1 Tax=Methylobacterium haplocladii TaxID=1176176 RepID=A0A512ITQ7_9HYPH|nr:hypothetical protein [Methylobacterium haplocladii]GEP01092.1 hypothetical protein MHA02_34790 [Methylobacterium haplocladii]GJD85251.1 hypothetical protein HPGCJGGD_3138 [Methylobacterium haplocladii]GLS60031.1 hypothetical protein GCM10007887_27070 [Methylobacterium haplocladii]
MTSVREPGAGAAVTGLFLGSLAIAGAVALVTAPITPRMALAQTVAGSSDRSIAAPGSLDGRADSLDRLSHRYRRDTVGD